MTGEEERIVVMEKNGDTTTGDAHNSDAPKTSSTALRVAGRRGRPSLQMSKKLQKNETAPASSFFGS